MHLWEGAAQRSNNSYKLIRERALVVVWSADALAAIPNILTDNAHYILGECRAEGHGGNYKIRNNFVVLVDIYLDVQPVTLRGSHSKEEVSSSQSNGTIETERAAYDYAQVPHTFNNNSTSIRVSAIIVSNYQRNTEIDSLGYFESCTETHNRKSFKG